MLLDKYVSFLIAYICHFSAVCLAGAQSCSWKCLCSHEPKFGVLKLLIMEYQVRKKEELKGFSITPENEKIICSSKDTTVT